MGLVDYGSSGDESDSGHEAAQTPASTLVIDQLSSIGPHATTDPVATAPRKSLFAALPKPQNRHTSDRKKIIVDLPPQKSLDDTHIKQDDILAPPPSRVRKAGASGLSALLPPPKRSAFNPPPASSTAAVAAVISSAKQGDQVISRSSNKDDGVGESLMAVPDDQIQITGSNLAFRPKSIRPTTRVPSSTSKKPVSVKQSLFSIYTPTAPADPSGRDEGVVEGEYQPILATQGRPLATTATTTVYTSELEEEQTSPQYIHPSDAYRYDPTVAVAAESSEGIDPSTLQHASNRQPPTSSRRRAHHQDAITLDPSTTIIDYDVSSEYAKNETLSQSNDVSSVAPVRFVGGGKHQLSGLLQLAQSQAETMEETFATQRRAMAEGKARYGR